MDLRPLASNVTELRLPTKVGMVSILFSYRTAVAATLADGTRVRTSTYYSKTTSKHLNQHGYKEAKEVPQGDIDALKEGV